jgi:hypothetical protein
MLSIAGMTSKGCFFLLTVIPVEPDAAAALGDARNRAAVGRLVSRVLRPRSGPSKMVG